MDAALHWGLARLAGKYRAMGVVWRWRRLLWNRWKAVVYLEIGVGTGNNISGENKKGAKRWLDSVVVAAANRQLSPIRSKRSRSKKATNKGKIPEGKQMKGALAPFICCITPNNKRTGQSLT